MQPNPPFFIYSSGHASRFLTTKAQHIRSGMCIIYRDSAQYMEQNSGFSLLGELPHKNSSFLTKVFGSVASTCTVGDHTMWQRSADCLTDWNNELIFYAIFLISYIMCSHCPKDCMYMCLCFRYILLLWMYIQCTAPEMWFLYLLDCIRMNLRNDNYNIMRHSHHIPY